MSAGGLCSRKYYALICGEAGQSVRRVGTRGAHRLVFVVNGNFENGYLMAVSLNSGTKAD
jgi:hypothetical protein